MKKLILNYQVLFCALAIIFLSEALSAQTLTPKKVTKGTIPSYLTLAPEIPYAGEVPMVPNVRPVIVLQGSDYEMGYQHAQQIIQILGRYFFESKAKVQPGENSITSLKKTEAAIKKYTPWAIDYVKGMADGSTAAGIPITYIQMLSYFTGPDGSEDCSGWAAWGSTTKDGKLICGGNGDHEIRIGSTAEYRFEINIMLYPKTGNNYIFTPPSGGAGHPGMNNKGVVNVHHGTTNYYDRYINPEKRSSAENVPKVFVLMHCLRFANTAEEAMDLALSIPSNQGGIWADVKGNAMVIENKDNPRVIRRPGDNGEKDFLYSTNNLFSDELKGAYDPLPKGHKLIKYPHAGYMGSQGSIGSIGRNLGFWNLFQNYHGEVDLDFAKMMWRFQGPPLPYATIDEAVEDEQRSQAIRWDAHFSQPGNSVATILQADDGDNGIIHISHGCAVRGNDSPTYPGGVIVRLNPTYTFFELKLGSNPSDVCNAAQTRARYDLWNAYQELSKLNFSDVRYAELDKKLNEAVVEWQKGWFYRDEASASTGNESMIKRAMAIRCYTKCQCYARQVYETIIPPPKRPEDLKLRQLFGNWGEWATRSSGVIIKEY